MSMVDVDFLTIPDHMRSIIFPDKNVSVSSLLLSRLLSPTVTDPRPLHQYFSSDNPHHESSHPSYLCTLTTPTPGVLRRLLDEAPRAKAAGAQSILYAHTDSEQRFPFWVLTFWTEVHALLDTQRKWLVQRLS
ncbi:hypothetical protein M405DRAFT_935071 [Rhizopogon salebrosus TDB-379]|nr:hypothetical protein M405DRAFT_935071 [Rhizopogon salebrosus TDB-379]